MTVILCQICACGHADPNWNDSARDSMAIVAVTFGDHWEGEHEFGEKDKNPFGLGRNLHLVDNGTTFTAVVKNPRMIW